MDHRLVRVSSQVAGFVGHVGVSGVCSCGWIGGAHDTDTQQAVRRLTETWEEHIESA